MSRRPTKLRVTILDRYVGAAYLRMFSMCLFGFVVIYLLVDFIERSSQLFKKNPETIHVVMYFVYKLPQMLYQVLPVACLLGSLLSLTILAKNSELTAIKAGGVPILRSTAAILALSALLSAATFALGEYVVPGAVEKKDYVYKVNIKMQEWKEKYRKENMYYRDGDTIYSFGLFVPEQDKITDARMFKLDEHFRIVERATAAEAKYENGQWYFIDGTYRRFSDGVPTESVAYDKYPVPLREKPDRMKVYLAEPEHMSYGELARLARDLQRQGADVTRYKVDMQSKLAYAAVPLIMAILGIPFAVRIGRSGGVALSMGVAMVLGVFYWIVLGLGLALGHSGAVGPIPAAWGPHVLFGVGGVVGLAKVRQ